MREQSRTLGTGGKHTQVPKCGFAVSKSYAREAKNRIFSPSSYTQKQRGAGVKAVMRAACLGWSPILDRQ